MQKCVSTVVLTVWLYALVDEKFVELIGASKEDCEEEDEEDVTYYLSEATDKMKDWLKERGLYVGKVLDSQEDYIYYDPDQFRNIEIAAKSVMADYDDDFDTLRELGCFPPYRDEAGEPVEGTPWRKWNLGGDDDVDYNGGYILIALDILKCYEERPQ